MRRGSTLITLDIHEADHVFFALDLALPVIAGLARDAVADPETDPEIGTEIQRLHGEMTQLQSRIARRLDPAKEEIKRRRMGQ